MFVLLIKTINVECVCVCVSLFALSLQILMDLSTSTAYDVFLLNIFFFLNEIVATFHVIYNRNYYSTL